MTDEFQLFKEVRPLKMYSLAIRDDWTFKIKRTNITEREKDLYLKTFGEKIITYSEFYNWWCKINNRGKYSS